MKTSSAEGPGMSVVDTLYRTGSRRDPYGTLVSLRNEFEYYLKAVKSFRTFEQNNEKIFIERQFLKHCMANLYNPCKQFGTL